MMDVVRRADVSTQTAFLCVHPELAGKEAAAGTMTHDSVTEQASAGLDALSGAEVAELRGLNQRYRTRHGFPFIVAVRRFTKSQIFERTRLRDRTRRSARPDRSDHPAAPGRASVRLERRPCVVGQRRPDVSRLHYAIP